MNGDAISHFVGTVGINQYCLGKWGHMVPLDVGESEDSGVTLQVQTPGFIAEQNMEYTWGCLKRD